MIAITNERQSVFRVGHPVFRPTGELHGNINAVEYDYYGRGIDRAVLLTSSGNVLYISSDAVAEGGFRLGLVANPVTPTVASSDYSPCPFHIGQRLYTMRQGNLSFSGSVATVHPSRALGVYWCRTDLAIIETSFDFKRGTLSVGRFLHEH